jgi:hypothetical protein
MDLLSSAAAVVASETAANDRDGARQKVAVQVSSVDTCLCRISEVCFSTTNVMQIRRKYPAGSLLLFAQLLEVARNALGAAKMSRVDAERSLVFQVKSTYLQVAQARENRVQIVSKIAGNRVISGVLAWTEWCSQARTVPQQSK